MYKKVLVFVGSFILGLSAITSVVSSNHQKNIGQKEQNIIENGNMS